MRDAVHLLKSSIPPELQGLSPEALDNALRPLLWEMICEHAPEWLEEARVAYANLPIVVVDDDLPMSERTLQ